MTRFSEKHRLAARLFHAGPLGVRGDWQKACTAAGFTRVPSQQGKTSQAAIKAEEGFTGEIDLTGLPGLADAIDDDITALNRVMQQPDPDWEELARLAKRVLTKIATGMLPESSGFQVTALKEIIARSEGRVGQKEEKRKEELVGVVVLPTMTRPEDHMVVVVDVEDS